jgi:hypothetical protein
MPSSLSPLLGYNTNVRHRGKVFHVQTEDSGARYGHVITHLFVDGGRILKSFKSSYADHVGTEQQSDVVRGLMKRQHKAMLLALRDGRFDALAEIDESASTGPAPVPQLPSTTRPHADASHATASKVQPPTPKAPVVIRRMPGGVPPSIQGASLPRTGVARTAATTEAQQPNHRRPPRPIADPLPPPIMAAAPSPSAPHVGARPPASGAFSHVGQRRLVPSRPSSAFGHAKPHQGKSIFGEDATTDKSLDEVILSYLAMDSDPEGKG